MAQRKKKDGKAKKRVCILCGKPIRKGEDLSTYRVEGDVKGFKRSFDLEKAFHNACITQEEGINEIARAQVLDYIEAVTFNNSVVDQLRQQNLERAEQLLKEIRWRQGYQE